MERTASDSMTQTKRNVFNVVHIDLDSSLESGAMSDSTALANGQEIQSRSMVFAISRIRSSESDTV